MSAQIACISTTFQNRPAFGRKAGPGQLQQNVIKAPRRLILRCHFEATIALHI